MGALDPIIGVGSQGALAQVEATTHHTTHHVPSAAACLWDVWVRAIQLTQT
jgi:hypothetical protein